LLFDVGIDVLLFARDLDDGLDERSLAKVEGALALRAVATGRQVFPGRVGRRGR